MFLFVFLTLHLAINLTSLISREAYETACKFMDENIFINDRLHGYTYLLLLRIWGCLVFPSLKNYIL